MCDTARFTTFAGEGKKLPDLQTDTIGFGEPLPLPRTDTDLQDQLIRVDDDLGEQDIESLKFLCRDVLSYSSLEKSSSGIDLFTLLKMGGHITPDNVDFILECFGRIHRLDLVKRLGYNPSLVRDNLAGYNRLTPFRILLFEMAEEITDKELGKIKFMLNGQVGKKKLQDIETTLQLFVFLEHEGRLLASDLTLLETILRAVQRQDLIAQINVFRDNTLGRVLAPPLVPRDITVAPELAEGEEGRVIRPRPVQQDNQTNVGSASAGTVTLSSGGDNSVQQAAPGDVIVQDDWLLAISEKVFPHFESLARELGVSEVEGSAATRGNNPVFRMYYLLLKWRDSVRDQGQAGSILIDALERLGLITESKMIQDFLNEYETRAASEQRLRQQQWVDSQSEVNRAVMQEQEEPNNCSSLREAAVQPPNRNTAGDTVTQTMAPREAAPQQSGQSFQPSQTIPLDPQGILLQRLQNWHIQPGQVPVTQPPKQVLSAPLPMQNTGCPVPGQNFGVPIPGQNVGVPIPGGNVGAPVPVQNVGAPVPGGNVGAPVPGQQQVLGQYQGLVATGQAEADPLPEYTMTNKPRGICVIINNEKFYKDRNDPAAKEVSARIGSHHDRDNLNVIFDKLGFKVIIKDNLSAVEMSRLLVEVSHNIDHTNYDCFVCCILTHGVMNQLYGANGCLVSIRDLTATFQASRCPSLAGKPKLFFLQACQGRDKMSGGNVEMDGDPPNVYETDGDSDMIPNEADFLLGYATVPGYVSFRSRTHGSWYIRKLTQMLDTYSHRDDLMSILVKVNQEVSKGDAQMEGAVYKQVPAPLVTLRKKVFFRQ